MRESEIEKILVDEVKNLGGRAYKWVSPGNAGVPDRIVILPDAGPIFVELKTETGRPTALQGAQIRRLKNLGQRVEVVRGLSGLIQFFGDLGRHDVARRIAMKFAGGGVI